ncbi:serine hydrolase [Bradyrhizobium lablabi]|uniref:serine hydrolase domain-containing protein n=1 Tax=Bradyrhizobium lablabi TaxID=722472 RepID=UPI001BAB96C6|nr:serine hydrolase [Bradyrhizobium lablabi]MBR0691991.1 serine hydrolase [Bradyrhizobium lablabi]
MQGGRLAVSMLGSSLLLASVLASSGAVRAQGGDPVWPTTQWLTSTPEEQGMESAALARLVSYGTARSFDSLLIARHGRIVLDAYYAPYTADIPHVINSATKAVIGTLTAMLIKDGLLDSVDHHMLNFFSDRSIASVDVRKQAITIQHLLDMTSGLDWKEGVEGGRPDSLIEWERSRDVINFVLDRPMANEPGEVFYYNSGNAQLLSAVISKLTGLSARDYAMARLFRPLGIAAPTWHGVGQGLSQGGGGLMLAPRDAAKIGYLYLHDGEWERQHLLPPNWVERIRHATVEMHTTFDPTMRYANFFWVMPGRQVIMAVGDRCQLIMVLPTLDVIAVVTARDYCSFGKLAADITGAVKSDVALPADPVGANLLAGELRDIATERTTAVGATPETAATISGKTYRFARSAFDVRKISLDLNGALPRYELEMSTPDPARPSIRLAGPIGLDGRYRLGDTTPLGVMALKGTWQDSHTFAIDLRMVGGDTDRKWLLSFDGAKARLNGKDRFGHDVQVDSE